MQKKVKLGDQHILFGSSKCPACLAQYSLINKEFLKKKKTGQINYYDLDKYPPPKIIMDRDGNYSMPTHYIPTGKGYGKIVVGLRKDLVKATSFGKATGFGKMPKPKLPKFGNAALEAPKTSYIGRPPPKFKKPSRFGKTSRFGYDNPQINTWKPFNSFPGGPGYLPGNNFNIPESFDNKMQTKWGDVTESGTLGREFGPGNHSQIYSSDYFFQPRMARPGGDLDTALNDNSKCNMLSKDNGLPGSFKSPGLFSDSTSGLFTSFGKKKKSRYGTNTILSSYPQGKYTGIVSPVLGRSIESGRGATQTTVPKINQVQSKNKWIHTENVYSPYRSNEPSGSAFGKKSKSKKVGPGTTLTIKNGKVKIKN